VSQAKSLRERGADIVVCLSHLGINENQAMDYGSAYDIAQNAMGIDVIIDGHTPEAELLTQNTFAVPIASISEDGMQIGRIAFYLEDGLVVPQIEILTKEDFANITPLEEVTDLILACEEQVEQVSQTVVGQSAVSLMDYEKEIIRAKESVLADIVADSMRWVSGAQIAFCNAGNVRSGIDVGDITLEDINNMLPYSNMLRMAQVPGQVIREALEHSASLYGKMDGGFLQLSGLEYIFDPTLPEGSRVTQITLQGEPFSNEEMYSLVVFDFIAEGGDGYSMLIDWFANAQTVGEGDIGSIFADYISMQETLKLGAQTSGRITVIGNESDTQKEDAIRGYIIIAVCLIAGFGLSYVALQSGRKKRK
jgi:5'-nucleotidase